MKIYGNKSKIKIFLMRTHSIVGARGATAATKKGQSEQNPARRSKNKMPFQGAREPSLPIQPTNQCVLVLLKSIDLIFMHPHHAKGGDGVVEVHFFFLLRFY